MLMLKKQNRKIQEGYIGPTAIQSRPHGQQFPLVSSPKETSGIKFDDDDEVHKEVMTWFEGQVADFYDSRIQKLVPRLSKSGFGGQVVSMLASGTQNRGFKPCQSMPSFRGEVNPSVPCRSFAAG
jgi:hypothetical protein